VFVEQKDEFWTLSELGFSSVNSTLSWDVARDLKPLRRLNPKILDHDAKVTSARLRILQLWNATFVPERAIKAKDFPEIPDGIFFFPSGRGVALEIENSDKGRARFLRLLERWKDTPSITLATSASFRTESTRATRKSHYFRQRISSARSWEEALAFSPEVANSRRAL
jgi:hypothetical protein